MALSSSGCDAPQEEDKVSSAQTAEKIRGEELQVRNVQAWWSSGLGPEAVASGTSPVLSAVDAGTLAEIVAAGGGYHTILSADRLDSMHRRVGECSTSASEAVEPLKKALQVRGGYKSQARAVGMLLFKEARSLYEQSDGKCGVASVATPSRSTAATAIPQSQDAATAEVLEAISTIKLEEEWANPLRFVNGPGYPKGASMAARVAPNPKAELLVALPDGFEYSATGRTGDYLRVQLQAKDLGAGASAGRDAFVLHRMGDLVLLVPQPKASVTASATMATETAHSVSTESQASQPAGPSIVLDESWSSPRRYICAETYPSGAEMAVKEAPSKESKLLRKLPAGYEYVATGRVGDFLQVLLEIDGKMAIVYVLHRLGDLILLVPADSASSSSVSACSAADAAAAAAVTAAEAARKAAAEAKSGNDMRVSHLEAKVAQQDRCIQTLQAELSQLKAQLASIAAAFAPLGGSTSN